MRATLATLCTLVLIGACGGENADDDTAQDSGADVGVTGNASVCGRTAIAEQESGRDSVTVALTDIDSGDASVVDLELPDEAEAEPTKHWQVRTECATTDDGPLTVVTYGNSQDPSGNSASEDDDEIVSLFGVRPDGEVAWYAEKKISETLHVQGDAVLYTDDEVTMLDAASGETIVEQEAFEEALPVSSDRLVHGGDEPALVDAELKPIATLPEHSYDEWVAVSENVAVFESDDALLAFDVESGDQLWKAPLSADSEAAASYAIDEQAGMLVTAASLKGHPAPENDKTTPLTGIDLEKGTVRWVVAVDSPVATVPGIGGGAFMADEFDQELFDSRTGERIRKPGDATVFDVTPEGVFAVGMEEYQLLDPKELPRRG